MANFCTKCGRALNPGETCNCEAQFNAKTQFNTPNAYGAQPETNASSKFQDFGAKAGASAGELIKNGQALVKNTDFKKLWENIKNSAGIGDPESNKSDAFEKGKNIIPECVRPNDSEIPVKQYEIATLRNRFTFITYAKAIGRIQVTNKRVIFRAPGRSIVGRTTLQQEFSIDEIAGLETRREYLFNIWDLLVAIITLVIGAAIGGAIATLCAEGGIVLSLLFGFIFGPVGAFLFFKLKRRWSLKLIAMGFSAAMAIVGAGYGFEEGDFAGFLAFFLAIIALVNILLALIAMFLNSFKPNLALIIKTKSASASAIDIVRKKRAIPFISPGGASESENHTGYYEILPLDNAEKSIREIGALINDIQKLGDFGIEKWQEK